MKITVYSKKPCVQCTATMRALDDMGAEYVVVRIDQEEGVIEMLQEKGFFQAPVVDAGGTLWSGHNPLMLKKLKEGELG